MGFLSNLAGAVLPLAGTALGASLGGATGAQVGGTVGVGVDSLLGLGSAATNQIAGGAALATAGAVQNNAALSAGGMSFLGTGMTNAANAANVQNQMNFQTNMANTTYQRAVNSMMAAGLNPELAYSQGGAPSPSGAAATYSDPVQASINSAQSTARTAADVGMTKAKTATEDYYNSPGGIADSQSVLQAAAAQAALYNVQNAKLENQMTQAKLDLVQSMLPEAHAEARMFSGPLGSAIPYLGAVKSGISSAGALLELLK